MRARLWAPRPHRPGGRLQPKQAQDGNRRGPLVEYAAPRRSGQRAASGGENRPPQGLGRQRHPASDDRRGLPHRPGRTDFPETHGARRRRTQTGAGFHIQAVQGSGGSGGRSVPRIAAGHQEREGEERRKESRSRCCRFRTNPAFTSPPSRTPQQTPRPARPASARRSSRAPRPAPRAAGSSRRRYPQANWGEAPEDSPPTPASHPPRERSTGASRRPVSGSPQSRFSHRRRR